MSASDDLPPLSHDEIERYSRHLILDEVGMTGQQRLKALQPSLLAHMSAHS